MFPQRPDRAYVGYIDGGAVILDIADKAHPKLVSRWQYSPPFNGFTHTVLPLFERNLLIVSDECVKDDGIDWPKLVWVVDARVESNLVPISTLPAPPHDAFIHRGGRFGAHNLHENLPVPGSWSSDQIVIGTFFNAGVRAYDISNPYQPQEVAYFVPSAPVLSRAGAIQLNDVYVDDRRIVYRRALHSRDDALTSVSNVRASASVDPLASRLPVTVITGFLGSGKTTLLRRLLRHPGMDRAAVIINEFGDVALDHELVEASSEQMTLLSNGCLCCTLRTDLQETLRELFIKRRAGEVIDFDRVFVETTGLADPIPVLHTLQTDGLLGAQYRLNGIVTLIDAVNSMGQLDTMPEAVKQAAVADRMVITKTDIADNETIARLQDRLRAMISILRS